MALDCLRNYTEAELQTTLITDAFVSFSHCSKLVNDNTSAGGGSAEQFQHQGTALPHSNSLPQSPSVGRATSAAHVPSPEKPRPS